MLYIRCIYIYISDDYYIYSVLVSTVVVLKYTINIVIELKKSK